MKGIGSAYWRIVGSVDAMVEKAKAIEQDWMKGIGYARSGGEVVGDEESGSEESGDEDAGTEESGDEASGSEESGGEESGEEDVGDEEAGDGRDVIRAPVSVVRALPASPSRFPLHRRCDRWAMPPG